MNQCADQYGDCYYCGGMVEDKIERIDYRYHGQLFIMEGVPIGVCKQCGEKVLTAKIAKKLESVASKGTKHAVSTVAIPVISFAA